MSQMHTMETPVTVQVILAVFNPNPQHLAAQIESVARQVGVAMRLHAVIADLASADLVLDLARVNDLAVDLHLPAKKLNAVAAFEFGLAEALESAGREDVFSLCDQDDVWLRTSCAGRARRWAPAQDAIWCIPTHGWWTARGARSLAPCLRRKNATGARGCAGCYIAIRLLA